MYPPFIVKDTTTIFNIMWLLKRFAFFCLNIYASILAFFKAVDYNLYRAMLIYKYDGSEIPELAGFWKKESGWWENDNQDDWNVVDLSVGVINAEFVSDPPPCVTECFYKYKFNWHNKDYKMITKDQEDWPPTWLDRHVIKFKMPLSRVVLVDEDYNEIANVTDRWKRYSGPYGDFFKCKNIRLDDIFTRADEWKFAIVTDILNNTVEYSRDVYIDSLEAK